MIKFWLSIQGTPQEIQIFSFHWRPKETCELSLLKQMGKTNFISKNILSNKCLSQNNGFWFLKMLFSPRRSEYDPLPGFDSRFHEIFFFTFKISRTHLNLSSNAQFHAEVNQMWWFFTRHWFSRENHISIHLISKYFNSTSALKSS